MNNASRMLHGAAHLFSGATPYRAAAAPHRQVPAQAAPHAAVDQFQKAHESVHAVLHHKKSMFLPVDIGAPELDQADADHFAPPPLDLDELAACAGQSRVFGPAIGRMIMVAGSYFAVYATYQAAKALIEDRGTLEGLKTTKESLGGYQNGPATRGLRRVFDVEVRERKQAWASNLVLLPGSLGMAVNLIGSAELAGHFAPALVPLATFAMGPAAICMTIYGGFIAVKAIVDVMHSINKSARRQAALKDSRVSEQAWAETLHAIAAREKTKCWYDAALGVSGALQAVGALLQWTLGPIYLLLLLPGTVGLVAFKMMRAGKLGMYTVAPSLDVPRYIRPTADILSDFYRVRNLQLQLARITTQDGHRGQDLRGRLAAALLAKFGQETALTERLRQAAATPVQEAQDLTSALAALDVFAFFAVAVAQDPAMPRTAHATTDGSSYTVSAADVVAVIADAESSEVHDIMHHMRQIACHITRSYATVVARQEGAVLAELTAQMMVDNA